MYVIRKKDGSRRRWISVAVDGGWVGRRRASLTGQRGEKKEKNEVVMTYSGLSVLAAPCGEPAS